eukprot:gene24166-biopygen1336
MANNWVHWKNILRAARRVDTSQGCSAPQEFNRYPGTVALVIIVYFELVAAPAVLYLRHFHLTAPQALALVLFFLWGW